MMETTSMIPTKKKMTAKMSYMRPLSPPLGPKV